MSSDTNDQSKNDQSKSDTDKDSNSQNKKLLMPQIGWFEILIIVVVAILVIGPKDFPVVLKKIGNWIGSTKRYFSDIQNKVEKLDEEIEESTIEEKYSTKNKDNENE